MKKALTIAGSDSGGGAGIQADIKTFQELGVYGMSAITAITAQNTLGVQAVYPMTEETVAAQIQAIAEDIGADAVKTGMLFNATIIQAVSDEIRKNQWKNIVVDPVMIAKGGASLLQKQAIHALKEELLPLSLIITPNIPEAEVLLDMTIKTIGDKETAAKKMLELGVKNVVIKGGHDTDPHETVDLFYDGKDFAFLKSKRIYTQNTHGTGCTFSAAITAELANGKSVYEAVVIAKDFIQAAIEDNIPIGRGHGPTNHWAYGRRKTEKVK
ncbi:bifunctional hydroxymethylpyrimidine kinase/phosphomethylpyrimidine kinase [Bacillus sp. FJAT-49736]|uniref:bifunctional hydroxymethylpyrimidine kinase/phosphomethylpyrimidine kinase n=1 Tax=Bacillus sp. FJAT-49736 TaxID=2833582 RepID=UPI001BC8E52E|nr:bifunctional hydroxymethylpyrimidine kinase/phosphomethylpyrimidine kinase [Bacillus sp. FJAT-49736]MBS4175127.1 bifunctional hydroxymethylpyrimidine kinase/phosphomethylpyrimidine kinase [Bacillus sp. FJAT-49736]